jgi:release factor glutamine methyltransferase
MPIQNSAKIHQKLITVLKNIPSIDNPSMVAWLLLEKLLSRTKEELIAAQEIVLTDYTEKQLFIWIDELKANKPLQYILGKVPFLDLWLDVEPPILIPRPETESWCASLIEFLQPLKTESLSILDMCTGSGCIALALADALYNAQVIGVDINPQAISLATRNAQQNNLSNVHFIQSDLFKNLSQQKYDLIVSNPPYISEDVWKTLDCNVKEWEDKKALVAENHGLALIEQILKEARSHLKNNSHIENNMWIEIGYNQGPPVVELFKKYDYRNVKILQDYQGHDRVVIGTYIS